MLPSGANPGNTIWAETSKFDASKGTDQMAKDAKGHGSERRGGGMPLQGHPYHQKTNDELRYIAKDAHAAAIAGRGLSSEGKYLDQVNDASTVLGFRQRGGADLSQSPAVAVAAQHGISTAHLHTPGWDDETDAAGRKRSTGKW